MSNETATFGIFESLRIIILGFKPENSEEWVIFDLKKTKIIEENRGLPIIDNVVIYNNL